MSAGVHKRERRWAFLALIALAAASLMVLALKPLDSAQGQTAVVRVLRSDASRVVLELEVPAYSTREQAVGGTTYTALSVPGLGSTAERGRPMMPLKGVLVGIPQGANVTLKIVDGDRRQAALAHPPLPAPAAQVHYSPDEALPRYAGQLIAADAAVYSAGRFYPAEAALIQSSGNWRSQRYALVRFHPLQVEPAGRRLLFHRRLRVELAFTYPGGQTAEVLGVVQDEGQFEPMLQRVLVNYESARNWRARRAAGQSAALANAAAWYKIAVDADGMYQLTCADLAGAGIDLGTLDPRTLRLYDNGTELAIDVAGQDDGTCDNPGDYLLFFGQAVSTKYTSANVYWLTYGGAAGRRLALRDGSGGGFPAATFTNTVHLEQNRLYRSALPMVEGADHWYWHYLPDVTDRDGNGDTKSADYQFQAEQLATGTMTATLRVAMTGFSFGSHRTLVYVNGNLIDDTSWSGNSERIATLPFPQSHLAALTNTITISEAIGSPSAIFVNYLDISYASAFTVTNNTQRFRQEAVGTWQYSMEGFTTAIVETFDITDRYSVTRVVSTTIMPSGSTYTLQFAEAIAAPREYLALTPAQRKTPLSVTLDSPSSLKQANNGADYIVVSHGAFIPNVLPLANYRAQAMRVKVVDVQDVYDEFSDGELDAQAIHDFLAYASANWQAPAPAYVLLVGDGTFDPNGFCTTPGYCEPGLNTPANSMFIPPYLRTVDPWLGETASDNRLVAFNGGDTLPNMAIGRLPANSAAEVDAMVAKILAYEQNLPAGPWQTALTFVADNSFKADGTADSAGDFWALSEAVANDPQYVPAPYTTERIYYNPCNPAIYPQCALAFPPYTAPISVTNAIISAVNDGRLIINYIGHAGYQQWAAESLFNLGSLSALTNTSRFPVFLAMTCLEGYFHYPGLPSLAETHLRLSGKGIVASWSATGFGIAHGHDFLDKGFFDALTQQGKTRLGPATIEGKINLWLNGGIDYRDLVDTFNLFGDPALWLAVPRKYLYLPLISR